MPSTTEIIQNCKKISVGAMLCSPRENTPNFGFIKTCLAWLVVKSHLAQKVSLSEQAKKLKNLEHISSNTDSQTWSYELRNMYLT